MPVESPPIATYRLQLTPHFGFARARECLPYLVDLGISHLYLSPIFEARPGSTHGYDQTDPTRVREALGGEAAFRQLAADARARRLGIILDIVPNYLAAHHDNPWWWRMLSEGSASDAARFFDVDWAAGGQRVVLPCLGRPLDEALAAGEIVVEPAEGKARLRYFDRLFPLCKEPPGAALSPGPASAAHLARQHYELAYWREGLRRINYRRFFDIADLAGVRVEDPVVFEATHAGILRLAADGLLDGVRVDHVDGLLDPRSYLQTLRRRLNQVCPQPPLILVEKILGPSESLPEDWPIDGTTGYEYLTAITRLIAPPGGVMSMREQAAAGGLPLNFHTTALECKRLAARDLLESELNRLTALLRPSFPAIEADALRDAIVELSAQLPVYRTYADQRGLTDPDLLLIRCAGENAAIALPARSAIIASLTAFLLSENPASPSSHEFRLRWQQFTGPLAAKGLEDTAIYRDTAFLAFNEVGSDPQPAADPVTPLRSALDLRSRWPCSLNPGATHDTKRGEDARARLAVLALKSQRWLTLVESWSHAAGDVPLAERLLVYQTLWSIWPEVRQDTASSAQRIAQYLPKALREAKCRSSWSDPNVNVERQVVDLALYLMRDPGADSFRKDLDALQAELSVASSAASLFSVLLRALAPGIPDVYQGTELPDRSLVDPDNRREPDLAACHRQLNALREHWRRSPAALVRQLATDCGGADLKLFVCWRALHLRAWLLVAGKTVELRDFSLRALGARASDLLERLSRAAPSQRAVLAACAARQVLVRRFWPPNDLAIDQLSGCALTGDPAASPLPASVTLQEFGRAVPDSV